MIGTEFQPGDRCDDSFEVIRRIGQGGFGTVYLAEHADFGRVALKTAYFQSVEAKSEARFRTEIQILLHLDHDNVVRYIAAGRHPIDQPGKLFYLAMEYIEGRTLRDVIDEQGDRIAPEQIARWGRQIADGLAAIHELHVVHRDVKPPNIMIPAGADMAKVLDLGIARTLWGSMTQKDLQPGTVGYMSPEQISGQRVDARSDVFALGMVLYELATSRAMLNPRDEPLSWMELTMRTLGMDPEPIESFRPGFPKVLSAIIMRAVQKKPEDRFATMLEMRDALRTAFKELRYERRSLSLGLSGEWNLPHVPAVKLEQAPAPPAAAQPAAAQPAAAQPAAAQPARPRTQQMSQTEVLKAAAADLAAHGYPTTVPLPEAPSPEPAKPGTEPHAAQPAGGGGWARRHATGLAVAIALITGMPAGMGVWALTARGTGSEAIAEDAQPVEVGAAEQPAPAEAPPPSESAASSSAPAASAPAPSASASGSAAPVAAAVPTQPPPAARPAAPRTEQRPDIEFGGPAPKPAPKPSSKTKIPFGGPPEF